MLACNLCEKTFTRIQTYKQHYLKQHLIDTPPKPKEIFTAPQDILSEAITWSLTPIDGLSPPPPKVSTVVLDDIIMTLNEAEKMVEKYPEDYTIDSIRHRSTDVI